MQHVTVKIWTCPTCIVLIKLNYSFLRVETPFSLKDQHVLLARYTHLKSINHQLLYDLMYIGPAMQDQYEEVDLISKGGNYGWRVYEGPLVYNPPWTPGGNTSVKSINAITPIMGYNHSDVNKNIGSASIMGGYVYRGSADPCLYGRYQRRLEGILH